MYEEDEAHGIGTLHYENGSMEIGRWEQGKKQGLFIFVNKKGQEVRRVYE